jgi:serine/threonine protein kinase
MYIITEYKGPDLLSKFKSFSEQDLLGPEGLGIKMALCIKECHDKNVAHLDIKLDNFLLDKHDNNNIILIDFGHSEILDHSDEVRECKFNYGTNQYICPEGSEYTYSKKSDIWSLGVCLLVLALKRNFYHVNLYDPEIIKEYTDQIKDQKLKDVIVNCLQINYEERPTIEKIIEMF